MFGRGRNTPVQIPSRLMWLSRESTNTTFFVTFDHIVLYRALSIIPSPYSKWYMILDLGYEALHISTNVNDLRAKMEVIPLLCQALLLLSR